MRWPWFRRKRSATPASADPSPGPSREALSGQAPLPPPMPQDALLRFAMDYLRARRARVRIEGSDILSATLPDGSQVRYTTSAAQARADEYTTLLAVGSSALGTLLETVGEASRFLALDLAPQADAEELVAAVCAPFPADCGRCVAGGKSISALCGGCPLRSERMTLRLPAGKRDISIIPMDTEESVEFTYRITGHDRSGRHDAWMRIATTLSGRSVGLLDESLLASARTHDSSTARQDAARSKARAAVSFAEARVHPVLTVTAEMLRARSDAAYQRRVAETRATFTRLRQERAQPEGEIEAALQRELAALAEVYGIDIEATLESVCMLSSPRAEARIAVPGVSQPVRLLIDLGRGEVIPPECAGCQQPVLAGMVCEAGHVLCSSCARSCVDGGEVICDVCADTNAQDSAACALCSEPLCAIHVHACAGCGATCCAAHLWTCVEGGEALCLDCVRPCAHCGVVVCEDHPHVCAAPVAVAGNVGEGQVSR